MSVSSVAALNCHLSHASVQTSNVYTFIYLCVFCSSPARLAYKTRFIVTAGLISSQKFCICYSVSLHSLFI